MNETQASLAAQKAIEQYQMENTDWGSAFGYAQLAYDGGVRTPAILWIIGYCYFQGDVVSKDPAMARRYFKMSADMDSAGMDPQDHFEVDRARAFLMVNSVGRAPVFGENEQEAAYYGELLYNDAKSDYREEALRTLCMIYGNIHSPIYDAQKAVLFIRQALLSQDSETQQAALSTRNYVNEIVAKSIAAEFSNGQDGSDHKPSQVEQRALDLNKQIKDMPCAGKAPQKSGGCYVATSVYGSYNCPEVWTLRRFRDRVLKKHIAGRAFISLYYAVSPALVKRFGHRETFSRALKPLLDRFVLRLNRKGFHNTPYAD